MFNCTYHWRPAQGILRRYESVGDDTAVVTYRKYREPISSDTPTYQLEQSAPLIGAERSLMKHPSTGHLLTALHAAAESISL
jgi:hypothetical protein